MERNKLGSSSLEVSKLCLGTMMMGSQTPKSMSKKIMSDAVELGINFLDTAEMYSVPPHPDTQGNSERYIGEWLQERGKRDDLIIASKVTGRSRMHWIRGDDAKAELCVDANNINHAIDNSLRRLKTDYIDLYQIHWPDRPISLFGTTRDEAALDDPAYIPIEESLRALEDLVKAGKIRYIGVSNENLTGVKEFVRAARDAGLPMIASIQNAYSLVNRQFEINLSDYCLENNITLLPYSVLAMGHLSGKYIDGNTPQDSRKALFDNLTRYAALEEGAIVNAYIDIAKKEGISVASLAHAFVYQQPFVGSTIIGATNTEQLKENINALHITLSDECLQAIENIHHQNENPCL